MRQATHLPLVLTPLLIAACAATAPPSTEFPPGARAPSAAEVMTLLRGKSTQVTLANGTMVRADYAANTNDVKAYANGRSDSGTWRAEDGRVCHEFKVFNSSCSEIRLVGQNLYLKRFTGEVVRLTIAH